METLLAPIFADILRQFPVAGVVLLMYWQTLKVFRQEQRADREAHTAHITAIVGRLDKIESHLELVAPPATQKAGQPPTPPHPHLFTASPVPGHVDPAEVLPTSFCPGA
jgi:hypothetical protein